MSTITSPLEHFGYQDVQAAATAMDGFTVRNDFMTTVQRYIRRETVLWQLLRKRPAEADVVKEPREGPLPTAGFISKQAIAPPENPTGFQHLDLSDPGQEVKSIGGLIQFSHYIRSLYDQQSKPWGDVIADRTEKLILSMARNLEFGLFTGDSAVNPLQFNGIEKQMPLAGHRFTCNLTGSTPDSLVQKLRRIVRLAINDDYHMRKITHIFTSGLGLEKIEEEVGNSLSYHNLIEIVPGVTVPAIVTQAGRIPIIPSPFIRDIAGVGGAPDTVKFYLFDINSMEWRGVIPQGGSQTYEPQLFDVTQFTGSSVPYLLEKRMGIIYGTLYIHDRAESVYMLDATVSAGSVGTI